MSEEEVKNAEMLGLWEAVDRLRSGFAWTVEHYVEGGTYQGGPEFQEFWKGILYTADAPLSTDKCSSPHAALIALAKKRVEYSATAAKKAG